jgi:hypothetical protein
VAVASGETSWHASGVGSGAVTKPADGHHAGRRLDYPAVLAGLRAKPGKWSQVDSAPRVTSAVHTLRHRYGIEVTTRRDDDGTVNVWASWPVAGASAVAVAAVERHRSSGAATPKLKFGFPPQRRSGGRRPAAGYDTLAAKARSRPGHWLAAGVTDQSGRVSMALSLRKRGCDVTSRQQGDVCAVWVRWPAKRRVGALPVMETSSEDRWESPPVQHRRSGSKPTDFDYLGVAEAVCRRQGRWARIWEGPVDAGHSVRRWFAAQGFNVATRKTTELGEAGAVVVMRIWVRWPDKPSRQRTGALNRKLRRRDDMPLPALHWSNPPRNRTGTTKYETLIAELKTKPGTWAFIGAYTTKESSRVYQGLWRGGCEVTSRTATTSKRGIWARWPK